MRQDHNMSKYYPIHLRFRKDLRIANTYFSYPRVRATERTKFHTKETLSENGGILIRTNIRMIALHNSFGRLSSILLNYMPVN